MVYYLRQGDTQKALQCKNRSELLRIESSPSQYYEGTHLYPELLFYALADDLIGIKQSIESVKAMAHLKNTNHEVVRAVNDALLENGDAIPRTAVGWTM